MKNNRKKWPEPSGVLYFVYHLRTENLICTSLEGIYQILDEECEDYRFTELVIKMLRLDIAHRVHPYVFLPNIV